MMIESLRPALAVGVSLLAALLILTLGNRLRPNVREAITMTAAVSKAALVFSMAPAVAAGNQYVICLWKLADGVTLTLRTDGAGMVFACIASLLWILTSVYAIGYMRGHHEKNQTGYFASFAVCLSSVIGIAFAANLLTFFVFYEILTVATYPLVVHYRDEKAKNAGRKYLAYTLISGQLFFAAIVWIAVRYGQMDFQPGGFIAAGSMEQIPMLLLFFLLLCGGLVKAGVMPLHGWLPSAMVAPTPVSALLHAVAVVKAGAFCALRMICYVFGPESAAWCGGTTILSWLAVATILLSSLIAMRQDNLKARLAFSTIGQLSYIVLGISILAGYSVMGALYHMVAHAFLKITLFMCAGAIYVKTGLSEISAMGGLAKRMPVTMVCFTTASLGIAGLPLMAGFVSKLNIIQGALMAGKPQFAATLICAALLALSYLLPVVRIAFGQPSALADAAVVNAESAPVLQAATGRGWFDGAPMMVVPLLLTTGIAILLGCVPDAGLQLYRLAQLTATQIMEGGGFYG